MILPPQLCYFKADCLVDQVVLTSMIIVTIYIVHVAGIVGKRIRARAQVDSIQVTYRLKDRNTYTAPMRGGNGGTEYLSTIADSEKTD